MHTIKTTMVHIDFYIGYPPVVFIVGVIALRTFYREFYRFIYGSHKHVDWLCIGIFLFKIIWLKIEVFWVNTWSIKNVKYKSIENN